MQPPRASMFAAVRPGARAGLTFVAPTPTSTRSRSSCEFVFWKRFAPERRMDRAAEDFHLDSFRLRAYLPAERLVAVSAPRLELGTQDQSLYPRRLKRAPQVPGLPRRRRICPSSDGLRRPLTRISSWDGFRLGGVPGPESLLASPRRRCLQHRRGQVYRQLPDGDTVYDLLTSAVDVGFDLTPTCPTLAAMRVSSTSPGPVLPAHHRQPLDRHCLKSRALRSH